MVSVLRIMLSQIHVRIPDTDPAILADRIRISGTVRASCVCGGGGAGPVSKLDRWRSKEWESRMADMRVGIARSSGRMVTKTPNSGSLLQPLFVDTLPMQVWRSQEFVFLR